MIEETFDLGNTQLVAICAKHLRVQARWLLKTLGEVPSLQSGMSIQVGWSIVTVRELDGRLILHEPDFASDPFSRIRPEVSATLEVIAAQNDVLSLLHIAGVPVRFDEKVIVRRGALELDRVFLERSIDFESGDSGWYIGPADGSTPPLEAIYVYELLDSRSEFLQVFALPPGFGVTFIGSDIECIYDEKNRNLWACIE